MQTNPQSANRHGRTTVTIDAIRIDGNTQGRSVIDQPTVYNYVERLKDGDEFPCISTVFDGQTHWLVDGFHRYHAFKLLGLREVEVEYKPGTLEEAQVLSFGVNGTHGKPRTNEDKRKVVEAAVEHPLLKGKSDREIAKACHVSASFVGSVRDQKVKERQDANRGRSAEKKLTNPEGCSPTTPIKRVIDSEVFDLSGGAEPSREEIEAAEEALKADQDMFYKILESDDPLKDAIEDNKRLNLRVAQLETRLRGLMNERNEAVKIIKRLEKQLERQNFRPSQSSHSGLNVHLANGH